MTDKRGLVISSPLRIEANGTIRNISPQVDPAELRFALLFWDVLDRPANDVIHIGSGPDEEFLQSAGVLTRTMVNFTGSGSGGAIYQQCHVGAFRHLDSREPGVWSLATGERSISFPKADLEPGRGALVTLHRAVPVPDKDVALQDILEFREKRRSELLALRTHLEEIYARVKSGSDDPIIWNMEVGRLNRALEDHLKTSREWGVKLTWTSIEAALNLPAGIVAGLMAASQGVPLLGSIATGAAALLACAGGPALRRREVITTPFRYVSRFHEEVFL